MKLNQVIYSLIICFVAPLFLYSQALTEGDFITSPRRLIYEGKRSGEGYFNKTGDKFVFQSERIDENPFYQIYVLDMESGDVDLVSTGTGKTTCAFFDQSDDSRLLYASTHLDPKTLEYQKEELEFRASGKNRRYSWDYDPMMDIFVSGIGAKNIKRLTDAKGYDAEGAYSPDGKKIVFASNRLAYSEKLSEKDKKQLEIDPSYFCDIYIMDADGKNQKRLTTSPGYDGGPFFSPDGKRITWRRFTPDGKSADVFTMKIDGTDQVKVTDFNSMSWAPYYHPSMEYIIYASNKFGFGNFELFIVDAAGTKEPVRVTYTDGFDGLPVFHPDGDKLLWTSSRTDDKTAQLYYANWSHKNALDAIKKAPLRESKSQINFTPAIKSEEMKSKVYYLASEELEGRFTGSEGARLAANYIKQIFIENELEPFAGKYEHDFPYTKEISVNPDKNSFNINGKLLDLEEDYIPAASSESGEFEGEMVFVGYGIRTPENSDFKYNSYSNLDVKDKIVVMFDGSPNFFKEDDYKKNRTYYEYSYRLMVARELGAKGVIFLSHREKLFKPTTRGNVMRTGMFVSYMSNNYAKEFLKEGGLDFDEEVKKLDKYDPHSSFAPKLNKEFKAELKLEVERVIEKDNNILAMVSSSNKNAPYLLIGAHYDHLGKTGLNSRATGDSTTLTHFGADDNASGTAMVLEMAEYFADLKKKKPEAIKQNLVFALWSGEEIGIVGSAHFADNTPIEKDKYSAYINFDMVGNLQDDKLSIQGVGSSSEWKKLLEKRNIMAGFDLAMSEDPYLPTDATSLYRIGVPIINFFSGLHDRYHKPTDTPDILNYEGMEKIAKFASNIIADIAKDDKKLDYLKVEMPVMSTAGRGFGVYLGTIPDYVADVEGVKLTDVRPGSPAEKAGLKGGDIIIELAGRDIKNIYDYTNLLSELEAGKPYSLGIKRQDKKVNLEIIPGKK